MTNWEKWEGLHWSERDIEKYRRVEKLLLTRKKPRNDGDPHQTSDRKGNFAGVGGASGRMTYETSSIFDRKFAGANSLTTSPQEKDNVSTVINEGAEAGAVKSKPVTLTRAQLEEWRAIALASGFDPDDPEFDPANLPNVTIID